LVARGDVVDYTLGSRRLRVLVVSSDLHSEQYPVIVLIHSRTDGDVPGILIPLPPTIAGGGTIDLSRIRFADPSAFGFHYGTMPVDLMARVDSGLRRLLDL
jgi:mRNA-degrading endonuclease toxin of MazEF toxin-antitoxin module